MAQVRAATDRFLSGRNIALVGAMGLTAFALASAAAAWMSESDLATPVFVRPSDNRANASSFDARFSPGSAYGLLSPRLLVQSAPLNLKAKLDDAKSRLAQQMRPQIRLTALADPGDDLVLAPPVVTSIPLPRSRPAEANLIDLQSGAAQPDTRISQADRRTLLQKLSDMMPPRITLASLTPTDGLSSDGPDLTALGYDSGTAVYDISARAVYMPNGTKLEAHSGFGNLIDDPRHVDQRDIGATPPHTYELKPRPRLFHGVQALRMIPVSSDGMFGRVGLLTHGYMLGPNGDSNGCVSIKAYDKFLQAYQNGEVKRLVVVASLS